MAYRELHMVEIKEVLRLWARGHGIRTVARRTGVDRKTVRRYVEAAREAGLELGTEPVDDTLIAEVVEAVRPGSASEVGAMRVHLRAHAEKIQGWVEAGCHGPKLARLVSRTTGVPVPLRTMQRFVAEDLGVRSGQGDTVRVVDPEPGVLEVDFLTLGEITEIGTGAARTLHALLCTAGYSRHQFLWPCVGQTQDDLIEGLEAAWDFFGGVFPVLLPDNCSAIVKRADPVAPLFTEGFLEYAQARGFEVDPARVRAAKDKARVERQVRFSRDDYLSPLATGSLLARTGSEGVQVSGAPEAKEPAALRFGQLGEAPGSSSAAGVPHRLRGHAHRLGHAVVPVELLALGRCRARRGSGARGARAGSHQSRKPSPSEAWLRGSVPAANSSPSFSSPPSVSGSSGSVGGTCL